jgi:hypothetical protein
MFGFMNLWFLYLAQKGSWWLFLNRSAPAWVRVVKEIEISF